MKKDTRSSSYDLGDPNERKIRYRQASVGSFSTISPFSKLRPSGKPDPLGYVVSVPVINVPTSEYLSLHRKFISNQIATVLTKIEKMINEPTYKIIDLSVKISSLIQDTSNLKAQRLSFKGRGLSENRKIFFLISYLHQQKIKHAFLQTRDYEVSLEYLNAMKKFLLDPPDFTNFHVIVNLKDYISKIPSHKAEIDKILKKIMSLEKIARVPKYLPPPSSFCEQLIYPTSTTVSIFLEMAKNSSAYTIKQVYDEFKQMTDDESELDILLSHAFDFGWRVSTFPYNNFVDLDFPQFNNCKLKAFDPPYVPEIFHSCKISELSSSGWPYAPVVMILKELFFCTNPFQGAVRIFDAMNETASCVVQVTGESVDVDFDTLFPLILTSVLASGLLSDPRILSYIASISTIGISNTYCRLGSSYSEAILAHLKNLDETELENS